MAAYPPGYYPPPQFNPPVQPAAAAPEADDWTATVANFVKTPQGMLLVLGIVACYVFRKQIASLFITLALLINSEKRKLKRDAYEEQEKEDVSEEEEDEKKAKRASAAASKLTGRSLSSRRKQEVLDAQVQAKAFQDASEKLGEGFARGLHAGLPAPQQ